jgi:hypothetical protein
MDSPRKGCPVTLNTQGRRRRRAGEVSPDGKPACWRWKPPTEETIAAVREELRAPRLAKWGTEERAEYKWGPLEPEVRWYVMQGFQKGRCAICGHSPNYGPSLVTDHDHKSDFIRGLLCGRCNTMEGCHQGDSGIYALYRQRHPAMICGLRSRYTSVVIPRGFVLPPCPW